MIRSLVRQTFCSVAVWVSVIPANAQATTLTPVTVPAAQVSGEISIANQDYFAPGSYTVAPSLYPGASYTVSMSFLNSTAVATASGTQPSGTPQSTSAAGVSIYFEVVAPTSTTAVVDFDGSLSTQTSGYASAEAYGTLASSATYTEIVCSSSGGASFYTGCGGSVGSIFSGTVSFTVPTNTLEVFDIGVNGTGQGPASSWLATVDPSLALDPSDTSGGTLIVSADLPAPVPVPPAFLLLGSSLIGVIGLRCLARGRRPLIGATAA